RWAPPGVLADPVLRQPHRELRQRGARRTPRKRGQLRRRTAGAAGDQCRGTLPSPAAVGDPAARCPGRGGRQVRRSLLATVSVTPQPPTPTPHPSAPRLPRAQTLLVPGGSPRTPMPPEASKAPAREARK